MLIIFRPNSISRDDHTSNLARSMCCKHACTEFQSLMVGIACSTKKVSVCPYSPFLVVVVSEAPHLLAEECEAMKHHGASGIPIWDHESLLQERRQPLTMCMALHELIESLLV
jgi:hypothetical protein